MELLWPRVTVEDLRASRRALEAALADPRAAQWQFLQRLLASRANTVIGRELDLGSIDSIESFRRRVPVMPYEALAPYVRRIANGEEDVLFPGRAVHFTRTTGTTGTPKDVPLSTEYRDDVVAAAGPFFASLEEAHPGCLAHGLGFTGAFREELSPAGAGIGQPTGAARCVFAKLGFFDWAPEPVFEIRDFQLRYYALLYWALHRDIRVILCLSPSLLITLFQKAEELAAPLADDLEDGAFRRGPAGIDDVRARVAAIEPLPGPNPAAAARLRQMMATRGRFVPADVWPNLVAISAWKGEGSKHHLDAIVERCPGIELWPMHTGSSESALFVPLGRTWNGGVPTLLSTFHELYPEGTEPVAENFVELDRVEVGATYRVLLTNGRGMFRYPITDVFRVEGHYRGVPILAFSHRDGAVSLVGEKLVEADVTNAILHARALDATVIDYQLAPVRLGELDGYALLVEYRDEPPPVDTLRELVQRFDDGLVRCTYLYGKYRSQLAPPVLAVVPRGTFERMRRDKTDGKRSDSQYKDPRLRKDHVDLWSLEPIRVVGFTGEIRRTP